MLTAAAFDPSMPPLNDSAPAALRPMTVLRWVRAGIIPAEHYCKGAPWVIKRRQIENRQLVERVKLARKGALPADPDQHTFIFQ